MHIFYQIWHSKYINSDTFTFFTWSVVFSFSGHNTKLCPVSRITNLDSFSGFQWRVSCEGENVVKVVKISQLIDVIVTTIIWLKYCSYCIQPYPINQSINPIISKQVWQNKTDTTNVPLLWRWIEKKNKNHYLPFTKLIRFNQG